MPALIASARQVLDDVGGAPGPAVDQEPGDRVAVPENTVRPAKVATAIGEEAIMVIATDEAGQAQALILELDGVDDFIERIRSAQSEARRQNAPRGNLN
ncbi:MAG: hypothetical protein KAY22_07375 [Rhizorhabdus sp.]|uniref:hypothetical protein n=1 Tax=Rhizorhabdus sp. TaxID=1968843 RepID=UPI001B5C9956|nr:hypothetical protein [Rhizorhabdus sp.]MBP8232109.1 hypothetical protein [Rhizorhabdus sp.]